MAIPLPLFVYVSSSYLKAYQKTAELEHKVLVL
jgi:hypothetical protein